MRKIIGSLLIVMSFTVGGAHAAWQGTPTIAVISSANDSRLELVDEAICFWNMTLEEIGSGFRLGRVTRFVQPVPETELQSLSRYALDRVPVRVPLDQRKLLGDITIFLGESDFISFYAFNRNVGRAVIGIRGAKFPPINLPNVARNVIAQSLGNTLGLRHNSDPTMLMCGRPAPCRPAIYVSDQPRMFPLTDDEKHQLLQMYPPIRSSRPVPVPRAANCAPYIA
jgi:hypothetical protein